MSRCLALVLVAWTAAWSQPAPQEPFTDPATAGPDLLVQGEYLGTLADGTALGCQVMALGHGTFRATFTPGGLPGAGWAGQSFVAVDGQTAAGATTFGKAGGWQATLTGETLGGQTDKAATFALKRTVRTSPTLGAAAPAGAVVLFNGSDTQAWSAGKMDDQHRLTAVSGPLTKDAWQDFQLHVEFILPFMPSARGQGRCNSGVYLQQRYEIQILDSFGVFTAKPKAGDVCGEVYHAVAPRLNACFPPLTWQTYDLDFTAARFGADGQKTANARVTVTLNGILVQDHVEIPDKTGHGKPEGAKALPLNLQNHGFPAFFRNVWLVPRSSTATGGAAQ